MESEKVLNVSFFLLIITLTFTSCTLDAQEMGRNPNSNEIVQLPMPRNPILKLMRPVDDYANMPVRIERYRSADKDEWRLARYKTVVYENIDKKNLLITISDFDASGKLDDEYIIEKEFDDDGRIRRLAQWIIEEGASPRLFVNRTVTYSGNSVLVRDYDGDVGGSRYGWSYDDSGRLSRYYKERFSDRTESWVLRYDRNYTYEDNNVVQIEEQTSGRVDTLKYENNIVYIEEENISTQLTLNDRGAVIKEDSDWISDGQWDSNQNQYVYDSQGRISNIVESYYTESEDGSIASQAHHKEVFHYAP